MKDAIQEYTKAWVIEALELSAARGKRSWGYALGILGKWKANGKDNANGKHNQPTAGESHATQPQYKDGDCPTCKNIRFVRTASGSMTDCPDCRITAVRHE